MGGTVQCLQLVNGAEGKVRDLHEGDKQSAGSTLAHFDSADFQRERDVAAERLNTAIARRKQVDADSEEAQSAYDRAVRLFAKQATAQATLEGAKARQLNTKVAIDVAERDIATARIQLRQSEENLSYSTLLAPFPETTIAFRSVDTHQRVSAGQVAFVVHDVSSVVVTFAVPDSLLSPIRFGEVVEVTAVGLPDDRFRAIIHKIGSAANDQTRSYPIEVRIDQPRTTSGNGGHGLLSTRADGHPAPHDGDYSRRFRTARCVRIAQEAGQLLLRRIPIEIRDVLDNQVAVQLPLASDHSLKLGDEIVSTGVHRLRDGQQVRIVP